MFLHLLFWTKYTLAKMGTLNEKGQGLTEYAIIIMLIAIAVVATLAIFGLRLSDLFQSVVDQFESFSPNG